MTGFNRYEPPSPSMQGDENIEESFLKDVDKLHDYLPQPFRRIDKILTDIFELAWINIEQNASENQFNDTTDSNIELVMYEEELLLSEKVQTVKLYNNYLFVGTDKGLVIYDMPSFQKISHGIDDGILIQDVVDITVLSGNSYYVILLIQHKNGLFMHNN